MSPIAPNRDSYGGAFVTTGIKQGTDSSPRQEQPLSIGNAEKDNATTKNPSWYLCMEQQQEVVASPQSPSSFELSLESFHGQEEHIAVSGKDGPAKACEQREEEHMPLESKSKDDKETLIAGKAFIPLGQVNGHRDTVSVPTDIENTSSIQQPNSDSEPSNDSLHLETLELLQLYSPASNANSAASIPAPDQDVPTPATLNTEHIIQQYLSPAGTVEEKEILPAKVPEDTKNLLEKYVSLSATKSLDDSIPSHRLVRDEMDEITPETMTASKVDADFRSPDTEALIQDATEKVKRFVHSLSFSMNGSNVKEDAVDVSSDQEIVLTESSISAVESNYGGGDDLEESNLIITETRNSNHSTRSIDDDAKLGNEESSIDNGVASPANHKVEEAYLSSEAMPTASANVSTSNENDHESKEQLDLENNDMNPESTKALNSSSISSSNNNNESASAIRIWESPPRRRSAEISFGTPNTPRTPGGNRDYSQAKKELAGTSLEFIQKLRGAAQKRKKNLARSRDSLVNKERQQRQAVALLKVAPAQTNPSPNNKKASCKYEKKQFKARPLPANNIGLGKGIPRVAKRPTTVPSSPLLGARRKAVPKVKALQALATKPSAVDKQEPIHPEKTKTNSLHQVCVFKARPMPATSGALGRFGQSGVPKVPKRPVTVPNSPCLGPRRRHSCIIVKGKENPTQSRRTSTGMVKNPTTTPNNNVRPPIVTAF